MNYLRARQLQDGAGNPTGLWHYTLQNDGRIYPIGYCRECPGHSTEEEAQEHYRQYMLDTSRYSLIMSGVMMPCEACGAWTSRYAEVGPDFLERHILCEAHQTKDDLSKLVSRPGLIMTSL